MLTTDGFPVQNRLSFLADAYAGINEWSYGKTIKVLVADFYFNPRWITWRGEKMWVGDYGLFTGMIADWVKGNAREGRTPMTKDEALDLVFEIGRSTPHDQSG